MVEVTRHFTASVFIVHEGRVLLHEHKKLELILPPGGHIDRDELPEETAMREVKEECGVEVELYNSNQLEFVDGSFELNRGEHLNRHKINEFHEHLDFVFYGKALSSEVKPGRGESKKWVWMTKEEIESSSFVKDNVKFYALEALEKLS